MLTILTLPTPSLRERSRELSVEEITTPEFQKYLDELAVVMIKSGGVGIASPQVGRNVRVIVVEAKHGPDFFINPEITKKSEALADSEEGCLSVPGKYGIVSRHKKVTMSALNRHGRRVELEGKNFLSFVYQHEIDHLDGILFIDKAKKVIQTSKVRI